MFYKKQEKSKLGPNGRFLYVPLNGSLSRSPLFSGAPELPATAGEMCGSVNLLLLFIFFNIVACDIYTHWDFFNWIILVIGGYRQGLNIFFLIKWLSKLSIFGFDCRSSYLLNSLNNFWSKDIILGYNQGIPPKLYSWYTWFE